MQGEGSGVVIRGDGVILTNAHVIEGASRIEVTTVDGETLEATVVGTDAEHDLAILKVDFMEDTPGAKAELERYLQEAPTSHSKRADAETKCKVEVKCR